MNKKPSKKAGLTVGSILILLGIGLFTHWVYDTYQSNQQRANARESYAALSETVNTSSSTQEQILVSKEICMSSSQKITRTIDKSVWQELKSINPDIVGWIRIFDLDSPDTAIIDYPIVYRQNDNDYYLNHGFDGVNNIAGTPFLDGSCDKAMDGMINYIYGHNMSDGSMFAKLNRYSDRYFYDSHKTIWVETPEKGLVELGVVACIVIDGSDETARNFENDHDGYIKYLLSHSIIQTETVTSSDILYCFVTCAGWNDSKRIVVVAKVVG